MSGITIASLQWISSLVGGSGPLLDFYNLDMKWFKPFEVLSTSDNIWTNGTVGTGPL